MTPANGLTAHRIEVGAQGLFAEVVSSVETLECHSRPGTESDEVRGFVAIELFRKGTREGDSGVVPRFLSTRWGEPSVLYRSKPGPS
jgi:hypothetical protein